MSRLGAWVANLVSAAGFHRVGVVRYGANTFWMLAERFSGMAVALLISVVLARTLGTAGFGQLQYAVSFCAFFGLIANLGLDHLLVRELVRRPEDSGVLLGTAAAIRSVAAILTVATILLASWAVGSDPRTRWMIAIVSLAYLLYPAAVVELQFQATVRAKSPSFARVAASLASLAFVLVGVATLSGPPFFAAYPLVEATVIAIGMFVAWSRHLRGHVRLGFDPQVARSLMREAWPLALSFALIGIHANLDRLLVRAWLGDEAIGVFASATKLTDALYYIPMIIASSLFPAVVAARDTELAHYRRRMQNLYDLMVVSAVVIALPAAILSGGIIELLFGEAYGEAAIVLATQMAFFAVVAVSFAMGRWMILEGRTMVYLVRSVLAIVVNGLLSWILIPKLGVVGAALAGGVAQCAVVIAPAAFDAKCRDQVLMALRSLSFVSIAASSAAVLKK